MNKEIISKGFYNYLKKLDEQYKQTLPKNFTEKDLKDLIDYLYSKKYTSEDKMKYYRNLKIQILGINGLKKLQEQINKEFNDK